MDARRPEQHGHAVERDAARRLGADRPGDLHRFASLAGRREERHGRGGRRGVGRRRILGVEEKAAHAVQRMRRRFLRRRGRLHRPGQPPQRGQRAVVPGRHGHQRFGGAAGQRADDVEGGLVGDGHVQQDERPVEGRALRGAAAVPDDPRGRARQRRVVDESGAVEKPRVAVREPGDVGAAPAEPPRALDVHVRVAQLAERRGQRAAEGAESGDRLQVVEGLLLALLESGVRGDRFRPQGVRGGESAAGEVAGRDAPDELPQAEAVQPERRAEAGDDLPREVVGRLPRLPDQQHFAAAEAAPNRFGRGVDTSPRRRGRQNRDGRGRRQAVSRLEHGVAGRVAQRAPAPGAQIVMPLPVGPRLAGAAGRQRPALPATPAQRLRWRRRPPRTLPPIHVRRQVQIHHPDSPPLDVRVFRIVAGSLNPLRAPRGPPSARAGATGTGAGTRPRPRARSPGARSGRRSPCPARPDRARPAPSAAGAAPRCGIAGTDARGASRAGARSSAGPAPARRPRRAGRVGAAASSPA